VNRLQNILLTIVKKYFFVENSLYGAHSVLILEVTMHKESIKCGTMNTDPRHLHIAYGFNCMYALV
jgi:hypothetical protein